MALTLVNPIELNDIIGKVTTRIPLAKSSDLELIIILIAIS
jgi:hypothetical protein